MKYRPLFIASIGNPGAAYANTPHSAGHIVANALQARLLDDRSEWSDRGEMPGPVVAALAASASAMSMSTPTEDAGSTPRLRSPLFHALFPTIGVGVQESSKPSLSGQKPGRKREKTGGIVGKFCHPNMRPGGTIRTDTHSWTVFRSNVYMNESGRAVWPAWTGWIKSLSKPYESASSLTIPRRTAGDGMSGSIISTGMLPLPALVILHDELEADLGVTRLRHSGSSSRGHRGLLSIAGMTPAHMKPNFVDSFETDFNKMETAIWQAQVDRLSKLIAAAPDDDNDNADQTRLRKQLKQLRQRRPGRKTHPPMIYKIGIGIGRPTDRSSRAVSDHVLGRLRSADMASIVAAADSVVGVCRQIARHDV